MALKLVDSGEVFALGYLVNNLVPQNLVLRLFQNDKTPADDDETADYTEANFSGYTSVTLTGASWTVTPGDPSFAVYAEQDFTSDDDQSPQTVYGYYLTRATGGELVWVERLPNPQIIQNNGDRISITPRIEAQDTTDS
jgi:hypothetical protein